MKTVSKIKTLCLALALASFTFGCSQQDQNKAGEEAAEVRDETHEESHEASEEVQEAGQGAENEFNDFSAWVKDKYNRTENITQAEWQEMKADYKRREAEMEAKSSTWDDKTKQEWQEVKNSWKQTEDKVEARFKKNE